MKSWLLTVDQATIPVNYTDYAIYIKGAKATPSGAAPLRLPVHGHRHPVSLPIHGLQPGHGTNDGDYRMLLSVASIEVVNEDAGELVNAGTTQIDPGRIRVSVARRWRIAVRAATKPASTAA